MKRKICVIASSRATYGYKRRVIRLIHESEDLDLQLVVTGSHLLPEYGNTINDIIQDGVPVTARVEMFLAGDTVSSYAKSLGTEILNLAQVFSMIQPDIVLVTGDRGEMFAACITASYMNLPVAHIQSGDVSGHIDGSARHAITKLSHIHFPSCKDSADRVERLGEEVWRIHNVGAPQLDDIVQEKRHSKSFLEKMLEINLDRQYLVLVQHPVLAENQDAEVQMRETFEAIKQASIQTIFIYPNVDTGNKKMISLVDQYRDLPYVYTIPSIERKYFLSLLGFASAIVGNSSCGILEAPSFKLPAVNIGNRQRGRMQAINVINTDYNREEIANAIVEGLECREFRDRLKDCINPYGDGYSSERIVSILKDVRLNSSLLEKVITY